MRFSSFFFSFFFELFIFLSNSNVSYFNLVCKFKSFMLFYISKIKNLLLEKKLIYINPTKNLHRLLVLFQIFTI